MVNALEEVFETEQENETIQLEEWNEPQEQGEQKHGSVEDDRQEEELENQESEEEVGIEENEDAERNEEENEDAERNKEENEDAERKGENEDIKDHEYQVEIVDDEVETELHVREENLKIKLCKALWKALGQMSSDLVSLDSLRYEIKHCNECVSHGNVAKHRQLVNDFKKQLLIKQEELKKSVKDFEHRYFTKYHHLPNPTTEETTMHYSNHSDLLQNLFHLKILFFSSTLCQQITLYIRKMPYHLSQQIAIYIRNMSYHAVCNCPSSSTVHIQLGSTC